MKTFQDFLKSKNEQERIQFIEAAIAEYKKSDEYKTAYDADLYDQKKNVTIMRFQKWLTTMTGEMIPDVYSPNHKIVSNFFNFFVTQENQYLLGNGVTLEEANKTKLGRDFDIRLQEAGENALIHGVAYCFWNLDHINVFKALEFAPLYDEETGGLRGGIRFWQIDADKPLRVTLYEEDGLTEYIRRKGEAMVIMDGGEKRGYVQVIQSSKVDGTEILEYRNYPSFPILPLWGNRHHQSELVGLRTQIDAFDLIKSGFANDLDEASMIYWLIEGAGGMDDIDLAKFVERMKTLHAHAFDDEGAKAQAHTLDVPHSARVAYLERLEKDLYKDAQALNVEELSSGNKTATEINAAYQRLDNKVDRYEYCVLDFLQRLFELIGIQDKPQFKRSRIINQLEETQMVLMAAQYLDEELILNKLPWLTPEEVDELLKRKDVEDSLRMSGAGRVNEDPVIEDEE